MKRSGWHQRKPVSHAEDESFLVSNLFLHSLSAKFNKQNKKHLYCNLWSEVCEVRGGQCMT